MSAETAAYTARMDLESNLTVKLINHVLGVELKLLLIMRRTNVLMDGYDVDVKSAEVRQFANTIGYEICARSVGDRRYANTGDNEVDARSVEDHQFVSMIDGEIHAAFVLNR